MASLIRNEQVLNQNVCEEGWFNSKGIPSTCLLIGIAVGGLSAIIGELIGFLSNGHKLNDPILLALSISGVLQTGLLYLNWQNVLIPIVHAFVLGGTVGIIGGKLLFTNVKFSGADIKKSATGAILISIAPIFIQEFSGFQIILWYGIAALISITIANFSARLVLKYS